MHFHMKERKKRTENWLAIFVLHNLEDEDFVVVCWQFNSGVMIMMAMELVLVLTMSSKIIGNGGDTHTHTTYAQK